MNLANELALEAFDLDEIPIGCVIVHNDQVVAKAYNTREHTHDVFGHAEINAIKQASSFLSTWKLDDCELYVTVEPCLMCYGSILQSRIKKVYVGSIPDKIKKSSYRNYTTDTENIINYDLVNDTSSALMSDFFKKLRS